MLVLTRKPLEKITIGPDIVVTLLDIQDGRVRLRIEAPPEIVREGRCHVSLGRSQEVAIGPDVVVSLSDLNLGIAICS